MNNKQLIRKELLKKRNSLTEEERKKYSKLIKKVLFSLEQYKNAESLLVYISYLSEVSTYEIIKHTLKNGKRVFCPKVLSSGIMEFYEINSLQDVVLGYKNIPEPKVTDVPYQNENLSKSLMIMPLVGFDNHKNRLGYGGGFYDRYLQRFPALTKFALAFECQRYEDELPTEETDIRAELIITEKRIL